MRVIYLGSPSEAIFPLEALLTQDQHRVLAVVTQPAKPSGRMKKLQDPPLALFSKEKGIPCLQPEKAGDSGFLETLRTLAADVFVTCAYGQILTEAFLKIPPLGTLNIHPSLLPKHRGATPIPGTILSGDSQAGISILYTVKKLDAGPLILSVPKERIPGETTGQMAERLFRLSAPLLLEALEKIQDPTFVPAPQDESLVTYSPKIAKEDGRVVWGEEAKAIYTKYLAYNPWPGSYAFLGENRVVLEGLSLTGAEVSLAPGELRLEHGFLWVGAGDDTCLRLDRVKPAGSQSMDGVSFWNGLKKEKGRFFV
jgi:methionyl-tRNA formyltransferase